jgi:hypothetical protein
MDTGSWDGHRVLGMELRVLGMELGALGLEYLLYTEVYPVLMLYF